MSSRMHMGFGASLFRSAISLAGAALTTLAGVAFLTLLAIEEVSPSLGGGYSGIITYLILPPFFIAGLILIPIGQWRARKKGSERGSIVIDFNSPRVRLTAAVVAVLTVVNIAIVSTATYRGVATMDSPQFCGATCHRVMSPEYATYQRSAHSKVRCTQCHVGSGAEYFVKGKATGVRQIFSMLRDDYSRPIPTPVHGLRAAEETCGECHAARANEPNRLRVIDRFAEDESNTWKKTVLLNRVSAAHWHRRQVVRFRSDARRRYVSEIETRLDDGGVRSWKNTSSPAPDTGPVVGEWRTMDCIDCHNRPAHVFERPKDAIDRALASGELDRTLPFVRREALRIAQRPFLSSDVREVVTREVHAFYDSRYPGLEKAEPGRLDAAAKALTGIIERNVFPSMNIQWNTYPSMNDHEAESGCFRCHVSDFESATAPRISGRCELCHVVLAEEEENPEILESLSDE